MHNMFVVVAPILEPCCMCRARSDLISTVPVQGRGLIPRLFEELFTQITERQQPKVQLPALLATSCSIALGQ